jgi:RimJ/RimL family protein N-acetyltransferase
MIALASFDASHLKATYRWIQQPDIRAGILFDRKVDQNSHAVWFATAMQDRSQAHYAILENNVHIGNFGYRNIDLHDGRGDLYMYLDADSRGRGAGTDALSAGLDKGFGEVGLRKITLIVRTDNVSAIHIYRKAGFAHEGLLKAEVMFEGKPVDVRRMGLLRSK